MRKLWTLILLAALFPSGFAKTPKALLHQMVRASFYAQKFEGRKMANGDRFHEYAMTAASRAFPLGTVLYVTNVKTGESIFVEVTDRGPWNARYGLDLSESAFLALGFKSCQGWGWVTIEKAH